MAEATLHPCLTVYRKASKRRDAACYKPARKLGSPLLHIVVACVLGACSGTKQTPRPLDAGTRDGSASSTDASLTDASKMSDASHAQDSSIDAAALPDLGKLTPDCFASADDSPQLTRNALFAGATWNDPAVLKIRGEYVMYASSDHDFDGDIAIYRLTSEDGKVWALSPATPVLSAAPSLDAWDHKAVETPSVVWFGDAYHMFYTGYASDLADPSSYRIGHAVSDDGITWTRDAAPIVSPTCPGWTTTNQVCSAGGAPTDFNSFLVAEPGAVVFEGKVYLYFAASGYEPSLANPVLSVGLIRSEDAVRWSSPQRVLSPDQNLYPRSKWLGYSTPAAIVLGGEIHLFFDVVQETPFAQLALHHARSSDGADGFVQDATAIFSASSFAWTAREIRSPAPLLDGTRLRLWFAGDDGAPDPKLAVGEAACAL